MKESIEIKNLIIEGQKAFESGDSKYWMNFLAQQEGTVIIGTDPNEWYRGYENIIKVKELWEQEKPFKTKTLDIRAFSEGTVGWFDATAVFEFTNGSELPMRVTGVFHQENGKWKIVQQNMAIEVPNEKLGKILEKWHET